MSVVDWQRAPAWRQTFTGHAYAVALGLIAAVLLIWALA